MPCPFGPKLEEVHRDLYKMGYIPYTMVVREWEFDRNEDSKPWHTGFGLGSPICSTIAKYISWLSEGGADPGIGVYRIIKHPIENLRKRQR